MASSDRVKRELLQALDPAPKAKWWNGKVVSAERARRQARARRRQEREWAAKSGPVVTYFDPSRIEKKPAPE